MQQVVGRQSMQLGNLIHLLHWGPAFPLTHTADAFWQKLSACMASSHLMRQDELRLIQNLAGQLLVSTYVLCSLSVCGSCQNEHSDSHHVTR